jgi:hypothetical protein
MAHSLYTTHHIQRRYWVAYAIRVVLVMASIVWAVMDGGERPAYVLNWDRSPMTLPSSNSVPAAEYPWSDCIPPSTPIGITCPPVHLGDKPQISGRFNVGFRMMLPTSIPGQQR